MRDSGPRDAIEDLAFAILEQAADDRHAKRGVVREDAEVFLNTPYPRDVYLRWLPVDVQPLVERIIEV